MKKQNPFKTPEGYFDNFAADFMARLPESEPVTVERTQPLKVVMLRPWLYAVCCRYVSEATFFGIIQKRKVRVQRLQRPLHSTTSMWTTTSIVPCSTMATYMHV